MAEFSVTWNELRSLLSTFKAQKEQIYLHYKELVKAVLSNQIVAEQEIEAIMDGLLDFCNDEKFLALYKDLCRHIYKHYPKLVGEHVNIFRLQFEESQA